MACLSCGKNRKNFTALKTKSAVPAAKVPSKTPLTPPKDGVAIGTPVTLVPPEKNPSVGYTKEEMTKSDSVEGK